MAVASGGVPGWGHLGQQYGAAQRQRQAELDALNQKLEYYQTQLEATNQQLKNLDNNPAALEKYAREKYFMKRSNEEVYVVDTAQ
jgi:cell division protein FtsB